MGTEDLLVGARVGYFVVTAGVLFAFWRTPAEVINGDNSDRLAVGISFLALGSAAANLLNLLGWATDLSTVGVLSTMALGYFMVFTAWLASTEHKSIRQVVALSAGAALGCGLVGSLFSMVL